MPKRTLSVEEEQMAVRLRGEPNNKSITDISLALYCSPERVRQALVKHGVHDAGTRVRRSKLTPQQVAFAAGRLTFENAGLHVMARALQVAPATLKTALVLCGTIAADAAPTEDEVANKPPTPLPRDEVNQLMALYARLPLPFPAGATAA